MLSKVLRPLLYGVMSGAAYLPYKAALVYPLHYWFFSESPDTIAHSTVLTMFMFDFVSNAWVGLKVEFNL
jgi:hypothetical protein